jgi:hypothetical protein
MKKKFEKKIFFLGGGHREEPQKNYKSIKNNKKLYNYKKNKKKINT